MSDSLAVAKNTVDTSQLHTLNNKEAIMHPEKLYLKNPVFWEIAGWLILVAFIFYMLFQFTKSSMCRNDSFDPNDPEGKLRPVKQRPYSYARVQLFWWSLIILFCYGYFFARHGVLLPLNYTVVILLGGPIAVFVFGKTIDNSQINENNQDGIPSRHQDLRESKGLLTDILSDNDGISIHRMQAVVFNIIYGVGFLQYFFVHVADRLYPFIDFDNWQFVLLGVSAAGYLGVKATENNSSTMQTRKTTAINMRTMSRAKNNPQQ